MWTPENRAVVGAFGCGQALSDDQYRLLVPLIPPAETGRSAADDGHAADARWSVLRGADRLPVASPAAPAGVPAVADGVRLLP